MNDGPPPIPGRDGVPSAQFHAVYERGEPAWCVARVQSSVEDVLQRGWLAGPRLLDSGCGTGENLVAVAAARPEASVTGVDLVPHAIERAEAAVIAARVGDRVRTAVHDLRAGVPDGPWDAILDAGVLHVFSDEDRERYLRSIHAALADGGEFVVVVFRDDERRPGGPRRLAEQELRAALESVGLEVTDLEPAVYELRSEDGPAGAWMARAVRP